MTGPPAATRRAGTTPTGPLVITPVLGMPEVRPGDDLAELVVAALRECGLDLRDGDVLVVSSKVVSKAQGRTITTAGLAETDGVDGMADGTAGGGDGMADRAGWAEVRQSAIESESVRVVAERISPTGLTQVVQSSAGPVLAAAGVDASNTGAADLLLLPRDPDAAAAGLRAAIQDRWDAGPVSIGVVVSDTAGRPWRQGQTDFALGAAGVLVVEDLRGSVDADGRGLEVTERAVADELAAAADLVKGKASAVPVAHLRGASGAFGVTAGPVGRGAGSLVRTGPTDWFGLGRAEAVRTALGVAPGTPAARAAGIAPTGPEPLVQRARRAVAVAMTGCAGVRADVATDGRVTIGARDPFAAGYAAARVEVALAGEGLCVTVAPPVGDAQDRLETVLTPREPG